MLVEHISANQKSVGVVTFPDAKTGQLTAGGTAFRRGCPDLRHLSRTFPVAAGRTKWPQHWVIIYEDTRVREQQGLLVRIDAATGAVLETRQDAPACPAATPQS